MEQQEPDQACTMKCPQSFKRRTYACPLSRDLHEGGPDQHVPPSIDDDTVPWALEQHHKLASTGHHVLQVQCRRAQTAPGLKSRQLPHAVKKQRRQSGQ